MNSYDLSRQWFDFAFENPEKISPNHAAIYFFAIEHCNRLGWKEKFGFPTQMAMDAIGIKKHQTYIAYFQDLVEWGFFTLIERSRNQYSANIISLCHQNAMPKKDKALDKAIIKHTAKHIETNGQSTGQSNGSIDKPLTIEPETKEKPKPTIEERKSEFYKLLSSYISKYDKFLIREFYDYWTEHGPKDKKMRFEKEKSFDPEKRLATWKKNETKFGTSSQNGIPTNLMSRYGL